MGAAEVELKLKNAVGSAIRSIRQGKGLTLEEVATTSGVDTGNLSRIERGALGWTLPTIAAIAQRGLKVPLAELFSQAERESGYGVATELVTTVPVLKLDEIRGGKLSAALRKSDERVKTTATVGSKAFAFRNNGNSGAMPEFKNELVVVDPDVTPAFGMHVVVQVDDGVVFRLLEEEGGKSYLRASNRQYPAIALKNSHRILGVARQAIRDL